MQNDKALIIASLVGLRVYAEHLASADLEAGKEKIGRIRFLTEMMASYHCVTGHEMDADVKIQRDYLAPLDSLMEGHPTPVPDFNESHMAAIIEGVGYYQQELEAEGEPVYERDIDICTELIDEMAVMMKQEEAPEQGQHMQF